LTASTALGKLDEHPVAGELDHTAVMNFDQGSKDVAQDRFEAGCGLLCALEPSRYNCYVLHLVGTD
jgi:hypothetical protein